jgi:hypothetical protein
LKEGWGLVWIRIHPLRRSSEIPFGPIAVLLPPLDRIPECCYASNMCLRLVNIGVMAKVEGGGDFFTSVTGMTDYPQTYIYTCHHP